MDAMSAEAGPICSIPSRFHLVPSLSSLNPGKSLNSKPCLTPRTGSEELPARGPLRARAVDASREAALGSGDAHCKASGLWPAGHVYLGSRQAKLLDQLAEWRGRKDKASCDTQYSLTILTRVAGRAARKKEVRGVLASDFASMESSEARSTAR